MRASSFAAPPMIKDLLPAQSGESGYFSLSHKCFDISYCEIGRLARGRIAALHRHDQRRLGSPYLQNALSHHVRRLRVCATG